MRRTSTRAPRMAALLGLCLSAGSTTAAAQEAAPIEPLTTVDEVKRYPPSSVRPGLIAGGLGLTAAAFGAGAACAAAWPEVPGSSRLYIPVAGPWIALADSGCPDDNPDCDASLVLRTILLVVSGLSQTGGLGVAAEGIFMTTEANKPTPVTALNWQLAPVSLPTVSRETTMGLGVVGSF